jgi:hypothetical protein
MKLVGVRGEVQENNMLDFRTFITEETEGKKLKHLTHVEDNIFDGHEGVGRADAHLRGMHDMLMGKNAPLHASDKYDGAPSIIFGQHPENGQFFVSTKSAHNKNPKINYTEEDIDRNHGHAPGLAEKLKVALAHLPKIMPRHGGVYQGDLMHTEGDAKTKDGMTSVTPNTITYGAPANSEEGKALNKKLGIVVHTQNALKDARPVDPKTRAAFKGSSDVNNIDPTMQINPDNYTEEERKQFLAHMHAAKKTYASMKPEAMEALDGHSIPLQAHINHMVRTEGTPSTEGYIQHLSDKHNKEAEKLKTPAARDRKAAAHAAVLDHIMQNKEHFDKALQLHNHLTNAKNVLVNAMEKNSPYAHSIGDVPTGKEGTVVVDKEGNASKLNNRAVFNRLNALKGAFSAKKQPEAFDEE